MLKVKIEVWSDYVCPFCYIGKRQLEKAISESGYAEQIEVTYKSFLLDPTTPESAEGSVYESLSKKFGSSIEEVKKMTAGVAARANEVGLNYNFDEMKAANTVKAHLLTKWVEAKDKQLGAKFTERLLQAYFLEGKAIGKVDELLLLVEELGLNVEEARSVIENRQYMADVDQDIYEAQQIGVRGVPFFVFNNKLGISGAQPQGLFEQTIEKAAQDEGLKKKIQIVSEGQVCTDGQCEI